jgi:hypothetical protein
MKQIHLDALPDDEVYFISNDGRGIIKGFVREIKLLNTGGVEYILSAEDRLHWTGLVADTKEELVAKFNTISAEA